MIEKRNFAARDSCAHDKNQYFNGYIFECNTHMYTLSLIQYTNVYTGTVIQYSYTHIQKRTYTHVSEYACERERISVCV